MNTMEKRQSGCGKIDFSKITFIDDYMFCSVMEDEEICRIFLERVLGIEITELRYVESQKTIAGVAGKGIRLYV